MSAILANLNPIQSSRRRGGQRQWHGDPEGLRGLQVGNQLEFCRQLTRTRSCTARAERCRLTFRRRVHPVGGSWVFAAARSRYAIGDIF